MKRPNNEKYKCLNTLLFLFEFRIYFCAFHLYIEHYTALDVVDIL